MYQSKQYTIVDGVVFDALNYPELVHELDAICRQTTAIPIYFKREIIISFLKDHCIHTDWSKANPEMARLMTSGGLPITQLETIFESCRNHKQFKKDLEDYIKKTLV